MHVVEVSQGMRRPPAAQQRRKRQPKPFAPNPLLLEKANKIENNPMFSSLLELLPTPAAISSSLYVPTEIVTLDVFIS